MTNIKAASPAQVRWIEDIAAKRVIPQNMADKIAERKGQFTSAEASLIIETYRLSPLKPTARVAPKPVEGTLNALIADLPKSKYAIKFSDFMDTLLYTRTNGNDLLFVEIREYRGHRYVRRLHGSIGDFVRTTISKADLEPIIKNIAKDPLEAVRLFGQHFECCGCCGAPLTDALSRQLQLGPECRKRFKL